MKDKITKHLVWRNCKTQPPNGSRRNLFITDGNTEYSRAEYYSEGNWFWNTHPFPFSPDDDLQKYWWTCVYDAVPTSQEFTKALNISE